MGFPLYVTCCFYLAIFNVLSLCLIFVSLISMCLGQFIFRFILYGALCTSWKWLAIPFSMLGKFSTIISSKIFSYPFFFSFSATPRIWMLVYLILSQKSLRLSSFIFILFTLFYSSAVISTNISSRSLIRSFASDILLLIPSRVFLISIIVLFFSVCLFFNSFLSLLIFLHFLHCVFKVLGHLYYHYSEFFFRWFASFLFIYLDLCVSSLFLHLCSISHYCFFRLIVFEVCFSQASRLNPFFLLVSALIIGQVVCVSFMKGEICACVLMGGGEFC